jgi:hypothetical protein
VDKLLIVSLIFVFFLTITVYALKDIVRCTSDSNIKTFFFVLFPRNRSTLQRIKAIAKLTLPRLSSGYRSSNALNSDLAAIEAAIENTLSRDGTTPNQMTADLDLNGNQILNLPTPVDPTDVIRLQDLEVYLDPIPYVEDLVTAAELAETNAETAATSAAAQVALATTARTAAEAARTGAETAETNAETAETGAELAETGAGTHRTAAEAAATTAGLLALAGGRVFPTATSNVPRGIMSVGAITAGSAGTNGTFALTFTGGNFSVNPTGTFTVAGGVLTAVTITGPGEYIGASPTAPTATFTNSAGLTGAAVVLNVGFRVPSGETYFANHASNSLLWQLFQNVSGTATLVTDATLVKAPTTNVTDVWLEYVQAASWETPNKYFVRPIQNIDLTGSFTQYRFHLQSPFTNALGDLAWHIVKYGVTPAANGTLVAGQSITGGSLCTTGDAGTVAIYSSGGTSAPAVGTVLRYSKMLVVRNPDPIGSNPGTPNAYRMLENLGDTVTEPLTDTLIASELKTPKPDRPVHTIQVGENLSMISIKMHSGNYVDNTYYNQSDHVKVALMNVAPFMAVATNFTALNSIWAYAKNQKLEVGNFVYKALDTGTTVETGLVWSAFEPVIIIGNMANAGDTANWGTNFSLAGRAHGQIYASPTTTRKGYRKDSSTGTPTAATKTNPLTITVNTITSAQIGDRIKCTGVVGMTQINDVWLTISGRSEVGNTTVLTFSGVNATGYGTFTSCPNNIEWEKTGLEAPTINTEWAGTRIIESTTGYFTTPSGTRACKFTDSTTFESTSTAHITHAWTHDFADAAISITPGTRTGSYAVMCPMTGFNRAVGYVNGVKGAVQIIDKRDGTTTGFGNAEKVIAWNADAPDIQLVVENLAGPGYTHFENGVGVAYATQVIGINNSYGCKLYWPTYPVTTPVSLAGKTLTGSFSMRIIRATPIT